MHSPKPKQKGLALFLLLLFLAPLSIQVLHHHAQSEERFISGDQRTISKYDHCFICSFEFVSFLKGNEIPLQWIESFSAVIPQAETPAALVRTFAFFSRRAPPLS
jgi:hypothetical protein